MDNLNVAIESETYSLQTMSELDATIPPFLAKHWSVYADIECVPYSSNC